MKILKKHEKNVTSITNDKISSISQRLDKLTLDINNNLTKRKEVRSKTNELTLSFETSQSLWETENKKLKQELTNLRSDLEEKGDYLKSKLRILEDRSRRNNIRVEGIPGSENEGWDVTEEILRKVIKDELDIENVVIERMHRVKKAMIITIIIIEIGNHQQLLLNYWISNKQDILYEGKARKIRNFHFKEDFSREILVIKKDSGMKLSGYGKKRKSLL